MTIRILMFASLAAQVGKRQLSLDLPDRATVADALDALAQQFPDVASLRGNLAVAVNQSYTAESHELSAGDELALIPPVSGG